MPAIDTDNVVYYEGSVTDGSGLDVVIDRVDNVDDDAESALATAVGTVFGLAVMNGRDPVVTVTEHRHPYGEQCAEVSDSYSPGMTACYSWQHDKAYYGF